MTITAIYILGHSLGNLTEPIFYVLRIRQCYHTFAIKGVIRPRLRQTKKRILNSQQLLQLRYSL